MTWYWKIVTLLRKGDVGTNRYGEDPQALPRRRIRAHVSPASEKEVAELKRALPGSNLEQQNRERLEHLLGSQSEVPPGKLPYAWGYWCAVACILGVLVLLGYAVGDAPTEAQQWALKEYGGVAPQDPINAAGFGGGYVGYLVGVYAVVAVFMALFMVASVGLFRRKRYGVTLLFIGNGLYFVLIIIGVLAGTMEASKNIGSLIGIAFWAVINYVYFKKRWQELS